MSTLDSTQRFGNRVADYVRYRPDYPPALIAWLRDAQGLDSSWLVADIGAGTGISSKMFLDAGHRVVAVEPNAPMRAAAHGWLGENPQFSAIDGSAENTSLADASVELISAAQAFHWFDMDRVRREWTRILRRRDDGRVGLAAIYWNSRPVLGSDFLIGYEKLLREFGTDYSSVAERYADEATMRAWFGDGWRGTAQFPHGQLLDFDALRGRLLSSSYTPVVGHPRHAPMLAALRKLFDATQIDGRVRFEYGTRIYLGALGG